VQIGSLMRRSIGSAGTIGLSRKQGGGAMAEPLVFISTCRSKEGQARDYRRLSRKIATSSKQA